MLMWDGRRDAGFNQVFGAIEASAEMNSSRLFGGSGAITAMLAMN